MRRQDRAKRVRGAVLVEGVVALSLIIGGTVMAVLFLLNVGMGVYYKEKLALVSNQAALFAGSLNPADPDLNSKTKEQAQKIATAMGLPPTVQVTSIDTSDPTLIAVTVSMSGLPLFGNGQFLPQTISLSDTAAIPTANIPIGSYCFYVNQGANNGNHAWLPVMRSKLPGLPSWRYIDGPTTSFDKDTVDGPTNMAF